MGGVQNKNHSTNQHTENNKAQVVYSNVIQYSSNSLQTHMNDSHL